MKEATGELNMTVITVVAVVAVGAFFTIFVLPGLKDSISGQTICANGANYQAGTNNSAGYVNCGTVNGSGRFTCTYITQVSSGSRTTNTTKTVTCDSN